MPTIQLNPQLWTIDTVRLPDGQQLPHGEDVDVDAESWEELRTRKTRQFGNRYNTYVSTEDLEPPAAERIWVRAEALLELTREELADAARERGLSGAGTKTEIADRIVAHETAAEPAEDA